MTLKFGQIRERRGHHHIDGDGATYSIAPDGTQAEPPTHASPDAYVQP